jgi:hypothetical protein
MGGNYQQSSGNSVNRSISEAGGSSSSAQGLTPQQILSAYKGYLPQTQEAMGRGNLAQLVPGSTGANVAAAGTALNRESNPEYYGALGSAGTNLSNATNASNSNLAAANNLVNSVNLRGLSPGEYNATERGLNQYNTGTGNAGLANPTNAISNAMNFGGAFNNKVGIAKDAIGAQSNAISAAGGLTNAGSGLAGASSPNTSGFNAVLTALGGGNTFGNSFLDAITKRGTSSSSNSATSNSWGGSNQDSKGGGSTGCCFIFLESYHGTLPDEVRRFRDHYYKFQPRIADGYKRMAKWLVPLMRDYVIVRNLVWHLMIKPATNYCKHTVPGYNKVISRFWLRVWAAYGK